MIRSIGRVTVLVHDQDEALRFYRDALGFAVIADVRLADGFRALHVGPPSQPSIGLWLMPATTPEQKALVGNQAAGEPLLVMYTDDCHQTCRELKERNVRFRSEPFEEGGSIAAHALDLYGNEFVIVQLK